MHERRLWQMNVETLQVRRHAQTIHSHNFADAEYSGNDVACPGELTRSAECRVIDRQTMNQALRDAMPADAGCRPNS